MLHLRTPSFLLPVRRKGKEAVRKQSYLQAVISPHTDVARSELEEAGASRARVFSTMGVARVFFTMVVARVCCAMGVARVFSAMGAFLFCGLGSIGS